jgi:hypothetical protein
LDGPLHVLIAMVGASLLARTLGRGPWGVWAAGAVYGLSGYVLSAVNLAELLHAAAWAPWVARAMVRAWKDPGPRTAAVVALMGALQASTLAAEAVLQSAVFGLLLLRERPSLRRCAWMAAALAIALLVAAPPILGTWALVEGTARARGLPAGQGFAWSAHPLSLLDLVLPRFFGDMHTFSDSGYWGQSFFPDGYPYFLSVYLGAGVVLLAARSGPAPERARLWALILAALLVALGSHGPVAPLLGPLMRHFRVPPKFLLSASLALSLLAAQGLERAVQGGWRPGVRAFVPAVLLCAAYPVLSIAPAARALGGVLPALADPRAQVVIARYWPASFATAGALLAGLLLALRARVPSLAAVCLGCDLLVANGSVNRFADREFYALRPEVRALVDAAGGDRDGRWFAYGVVGTPGLHWSPEVARRNVDVWLYYMDRQSLLPRLHVLDGLEAAFDEDRVGWAPPGSTLSSAERTPAAFAEHWARLREASVRWIVSFRPLPEDLVVPRGEARLPEILETLKLYEMRNPRPRAFWTTSASGEPADAGQVRWERRDAHTLVIHVSGPPGFAVVGEGLDVGWHAHDERGAPRPILRAGARYWAIATRGGEEVITVRFHPAWRDPALAACGLGLAAAMALFMVGRRP